MDNSNHAPATNGTESRSTSFSNDLGFLNLRCYPHPNTTLSPEEINVLLSIISDTIEWYDVDSAAFGTCILDGQKYGEPADCIFRFELPNGAYRRLFFRVYDRSSNYIAEDSIDEFLVTPPSKSRYRRLFPTSRGPITAPSFSGIYRDGELSVLALNATNGRFLFTFHAQNTDQEECDTVDNMVLYAVAEALTLMGQEDSALQDSMLYLYSHIPSDDLAFVHAAILFVREQFYRCQDPVIAKWRQWHASTHAESGKVGRSLFFEN